MLDRKSVAALIERLEDIWESYDRLDIDYKIPAPLLIRLCVINNQFLSVIDSLMDKVREFDAHEDHTPE